jgi:hypothetical protein
VNTVSDAPSPAPGDQLPARRPRVDYLIPLGILALWVVLQIWVLPKAGVSD